MRKIIVFPKAKEDISKSMDWYKKEGGEILSTRFKTSVFETIDKLQNNTIDHLKLKFCLSRVFVKHFPYTVFFIKDEKNISIFAVLHNKQNRETLTGRI